MNIIYPPKGSAEEYAPLACNYYCFCTHGCRYCYRLPFVSAQKFHQAGAPKKGSIDRLRKDASKLGGDTREIHPIVDHWKVGKLNHHKQIEQQVDWLRFREDVTALLDTLDVDYCLKNSLISL